MKRKYKKVKNKPEKYIIKRHNNKNNDTSFIFDWRAENEHKKRKKKTKYKEIVS